MQQALTQPEIRLRFILKSLLLISIVLIVFHVFPNWSPERFSGILNDGYRLFSNGSMVQAVLLVLLLMLAIGDVRRFNQIIRVFTIFLIIDLAFTILHLLRNENSDAEKNILYWSIAIDLLLLVVLSVCNRVAGKAR